MSLDRHDPMVTALALVSLVVGLSSVWFGIVIAWSLSPFPKAAYQHGWRPFWAAGFLILGILHVVLLARWMRGTASPALALVHRLTGCIALPFAGFSVLSLAADHDGYLITGCVVGGAVLALVCSRLGIWRLRGTSL